MLPAIKEEELPASVLLSMHEVALKPVCGGVGDSAEAVWQPIIIQVPWGKSTQHTLTPAMPCSHCQLGTVRQVSETANVPLPCVGARRGNQSPCFWSYRWL